MSAGPTAALVFPDGESVADLATFVGRARVLDPEGAIRLQAVGERYLNSKGAQRS